MNLNKQTAYVNKVNFVTNSVPLGNINIKIICKTEELILNVINWLTPETKNGIIIKQISEKEIVN